MEKVTWRKVKHPGYNPALKELLGEKLDVLPEYQHIGRINNKKKFSIIGPSVASFGMWEAYDGDDVMRFGTLKEAKIYCEEKYNPKTPC